MPTICVTLVAFEDVPRRLPNFDLAGSDDEALLGRIFRLLNHVTPGDAALMPTGGRHRSLSVGDVVALADRPYRCESAGWKRLTLAETAIYLATPRRDRQSAAYA